MKHQIDIEPLSFELKDAVNENDRFYINSPIGVQDPLADDLQRSKLLHGFKTCTDQNKINREGMDEFLESKNDNYKDKTNNIKQDEQLLSSDKHNISKSLSRDKSKRVRKSHHLQFLIDKITHLQLTKHDIIMIILNIFMILILLIVYQVINRSSRDVLIDVEEVLVMKRGNSFGGAGGEELWDDADIATLNFNDTITSVSATESSDLAGKPLLLSLTFSYSNDKKGKEYGGIAVRGPVKVLDILELAPDEHINHITIYEDYRNITNIWLQGNLTYLIVGIYFKTDHDKEIWYGCTNGTQKKESPKNYFLAYVQGKCGGFIDLLRFTWYKYCLKNSTIIEENDP